MPDPTRLISRAIIAAILVALAPIAAIADNSPVPTTNALLDTIGVGTHMAVQEPGNGYAYSRPEIAAQQLRYIGARHVRDSLFMGSSIRRLATLHTLAHAKFDLVYDDYRKDGGAAALESALNDVRPDAAILEAIEGPNEPDWFGITFDGKSGAAGVRAAQEAIDADVKKDAVLKSIPVYCPALSYPASGGMATALGNLAPYCDVGTSHPYMLNTSLGVHPPDEALRIWTGHARELTSPGRPLVITEAGWETCPQTDSGVDEATQAKYMMAYLLDAFTLDIKRTYFYELTEELDDPECKKSEVHYGLFKHDGTPKLAATALHSLTELLKGSDTAGGEGLAYSVAGLPAGRGHQLLLRKDQRTLVLALWSDDLVWDLAGHHALVPADRDAAIDVKFSQTMARVRLYDPLRGSSPQTDRKNVQDLTLKLPDHAVFLVVQTR